MAQPLTTASAPTDIYGGDEVSALVLDAGYCQTRAGFAGEDVPKSVLPSFYGSIKDTNAASGSRNVFGEDYIFARPDFEVKNYMSRTESVVEDWDTAVQVWESMLLDRLQPERRQTQPSKNGLNDGADGEGDVSMEDAATSAENAENAEKPLAESPLLMTEAPWNQGKAREKAIEIAMENWGCPAFWLSRTPVCAAFAAGKASALVVDVGGANTSVTAVHDGMILKRSIQKSHVGGLWLSSQIRSMFDSSDPKIEVRPSYMIESKVPVDAGAPSQAILRKLNYDLHPSYRAYEDERLLTEYKESVVEVWRGPGRYANPGNEDLVKTQPGRIFEMPDGSNQMWREQRYRVSEGMWDETAQLPTASEEDRITKAQTIPELIRACLNAVDVDLRPNLLGNIVVTGGTSLLNGFNDRLNNELMAMYPGMRVKLHAAGLTTERRFGSWIGGSILASLGTFHQMWISKKEYDENGAGIVEKRCK
ncbi:actin-like protein 4 [Apiospora arundinis]|uniref:Chromatin remodeling and histone acetyltransferase complexes subunit n=1 Tax=Apiospora arundinis TaxID=335852 RepID=A0ABR2HQP3_9PEZI